MDVVGEWAVPQRLPVRRRLAEELHVRLEQAGARLGHLLRRRLLALLLPPAGRTQQQKTRAGGGGAEGTITSCLRCRLYRSCLEEPVRLK